MTKQMILRTVVTEKSSDAKQLNKYTFLVGPKTNKVELRQFIEKKYNVSVVKINIVKLPGKQKRRGRIIGTTSPRKKAIVTLSDGNKIDEIEELF